MRADGLSSLCLSNIVRQCWQDVYRDVIFLWRSFRPRRSHMRSPHIQLIHLRSSLQVELGGMFRTRTRFHKFGLKNMPRKEQWKNLCADSVGGVFIRMFSANVLLRASETRKKDTSSACPKQRCHCDSPTHHLRRFSGTRRHDQGR